MHHVKVRDRGYHGRIVWNAKWDKNWIKGRLQSSCTPVKCTPTTVLLKGRLPSRCTPVKLSRLAFHRREHPDTPSQHGSSAVPVYTGALNRAVPASTGVPARHDLGTVRLCLHSKFKPCRSEPNCAGTVTNVSVNAV